MAITGINLYDAKGSKGTKGLSGTLVYLIYTDIGTESEFSLRTAVYPNLPVYGGSLPSPLTDDGTTCTNVEVKQVQSSKDIFEATYTFEAPDFAFNPIEDTNPFLRPPDIEWDGEDTVEDVYFDTTNTRITNSAKEPIDPPLQRPAGDDAVTITINLTNVQWQACRGFSFSTNSTTWYGQAAYTAKLNRIKATKTYEGSYTYWRATFPIVFTTRSGGWREKLYDYTTTQLVERPASSGNFKRENILDVNGLPTKVLLDGSGNPLSNQGDTPVFYPTDGWAILNEKNWTTNLSFLPTPF